MTTERENMGTWIDEIKELILRKQAENTALRKIQESLQPGGPKTGTCGESSPEEDQEKNKADEKQ